jgi:hypothetical protein
MRNSSSDYRKYQLFKSIFFSFSVNFRSVFINSADNTGDPEKIVFWYINIIFVHIFIVLWIIVLINCLTY